MKWKYCNYCPLDGTCENQDRGRECEMPIKKLLEENQQLKELLGECKYFLAEYDNDFSWDDCVKGYHLRETINKIIGEKK